ncbi:MAG: hypothetical protein ACOY93_07165 [Bacillota bacterium]
MHPTNASQRLRRSVAALALTGLLFSLAVPGAGAAPEAPQKIAFNRAREGKIMLMLELPGAPLAAMAEGIQRSRQADLLQGEHQQLLDLLGQERIAHRLLSRHTKLFNGLALEIDARDMGRVAALPGIKRIHLNRMHRMPEPQLASSVEMINAHLARAGAPGAPGVDGSGVTVAVVDTGRSVCHRT